MDPLSVVGIVESSLGLAIQFAGAAKALNDVAGKYKNAQLALKSLAQNLDILQLSWTRIGEWFEERYEEESIHDGGLAKRVQGFLETGNLVMEALQHDLQVYHVDHLSFPQRSKSVWDETTLQSHQSRIRDQTLSMSLFLQAVNLPTPGARAQLLQESESQFQKSNESAYSADTIVPSRNSVTTSQRDSYVSDQSQDTIEYRRLSFEKRLFMSKVYMRSSKDMMIKELSRARTAFRRRDIATATDRTITNCEAIRDQPSADSLLNPSYDVSVNTEERINSHTCSQSTARFFGEDKVSHMIGMTFDEDIICAYKQGDSLQVQRLIERGLDLHVVFEDAQYFGMKGIHVATMHGHINVIETLLAHGVTIEDEDASWFRRRPLHIAANSGQSAVAEFLIRKGAQVDAQADKGVQPIHEASRSGSITILDNLIEAGAAIDCSNWTGYQPIHWAAMSPKRSDVIIDILAKGADIEAKTLDGYRPLHLACRSDPTNLRTLIRFGAKIEYEDGSASPLEMAIIEDSKWAVWYLLNYGADPNRRNHAGNPILHTLALYGWASSNSIEICQLLLEKGADVDLANNVGNRLLHCLAIRSPDSPADTVARAKLAKLALDQGADIDAMNENGMSPLYLAILRGNRPLSKLLLERGARKLKRTVAVRADVQVTTLDDSYTPKYTVNIWRGLNNPEKQWRLSTQSFELSIDDEGYSSMVCEALGDMALERERF